MSKTKQPFETDSNINAPGFDEADCKRINALAAAIMDLVVSELADEAGDISAPDYKIGSFACRLAYRVFDNAAMRKLG